MSQERLLIVAFLQRVHEIGAQAADDALRLAMPKLLNETEDAKRDIVDGPNPESILTQYAMGVICAAINYLDIPNELMESLYETISAAVKGSFSSRGADIIDANEAENN